MDFQKALEFRRLAWNLYGWYLGYVWATVTADACTVWMVHMGQKLPTPSCESGSPIHMPPFLPRYGRSLSPGSHKWGYQHLVIQDTPCRLLSPSAFPLDQFRDTRAIGKVSVMGSGCDTHCWYFWSQIMTSPSYTRWDCLQWGHSWNMLVYPDLSLALVQWRQPIMQYFLLLGNPECFVYIILNCTQTMCLLLLH